MKDAERLKQEVLRQMLMRVGKERAVTLEQMRLRSFPELHDSRPIRNAIRSLRREGHPICSIGGLGHYYPANHQEVLECVESEIRNKAKDLLVTARKMRKASIELFGEQGVLW